MIDFDTAIQATLTRQTDLHSHTELDPYTFHPSQLAKCPRQCYASKLGLLDTTDTYGTFHTGTAIHEFMETEVTPALDVETRQEVPIECEVDDLTIVGHADLYEPAADIVFDYKTRANWYKFSPPIQRHLDQVYVYMRGLKAARGQIVYLSKADLEVRTWPPQSAGVDTVPFDPARFQDLIAKGRRIAATIIEEGYPTGPDDIPFEPDDCWFCEQEALQFDHHRPDRDLAAATRETDDHPSAAATSESRAASAESGASAGEASDHGPD